MNAIKSILLHLDASPRSAVRLAVARELASRHDATVTAMYAATPAAMDSAYALAEGSSLFASAAADLDAERLRHAREIFDATAPHPGVTWAALASEAPVHGFARAAWLADLLIVGQYDRSDAGGRNVPADFAEAVLIGSGKPALVIPYAGDFARIGQTVMVAWKPTRESARALAASLPLLQAAQTVHVVTWDGDPREPEPLLLRHGIEPTFHREAGTSRVDVGEFMLSRAADLGADLLVMGCYGHSRLRELVLGGATKTLLDSMTLPVLMAH
jgi:nucleotide-binding universal stress UspA family protein